MARIYLATYDGSSETIFLEDHRIQLTFLFPKPKCSLGVRQRRARDVTSLPESCRPPPPTRVESASSPNR